MGTRALWQTTNQSSGHGSQHTGRGSARRVREFRIGSDVFSALTRGEAVIYTPLAGNPQRAHIIPVYLPDGEPERIDRNGPRHPCEIVVHPEDSLHDAAPPTDWPTAATPTSEEDDPENI
jgi:hypothetical protein